MGNNEWVSTTLGELVDTFGGSVQTGPFGSQLHAADYVSEGIPSVMPKNIRIEEIDVEDIARISLSDAERLKKYLLAEGDIVYSRRGDVEKCALVTKNETNWLCGTGCLRIRIPKNKSITPYFLHALLSTPVTREWVSRHAIGATMPNLNTSILRDVPIVVPPFDSMNFIGAMWIKLNRKIILNRKINQTLEQMSQTLFKSWFVDFDPVIDNALDAGNPIPEALQSRADLRQKVRNSADFKPFPADIRALFPVEFEETEMGWVPKGWMLESVAKSININPGVKLPQNTVAKYVDMKSLPTQGYSISDVIEKPYAGGAKFQKNDTLFARITPCLENGKTGFVDFLDEKEIAFGSTEFIVMRGTTKVHYSYVACLARENNFRSHAIQNMVGSSGRQRVQNSCFDSFYIAIPTPSVMSLFAGKVSSYFDKMYSCNVENKSLTALRDTLLPKLISGELSLEDLPDLVTQTEPA
ncbi:restriction endonuclease subunit S [Klebsiella quasipneumoniae]|nr:restriction endonuclease subunit S [Klebsiella quasipneumoniae]HCA7569228.1 restriction endonuclease subunit S [Klebsiella quasipneumoniae]